MFTQNNPDGLIGAPEFQEVGMRYLIFQEEIGENGTPHLQGYIEMPSPCRFSKFRDILPGAHFEIARGTPDQCKAYCSKEDTRISGPYEIGTFGATQGVRTDMLALRDAVRSGKHGRDLYDDDLVAGSAIKYGRGVDRMAQAYAVQHKRPVVTTTFHYGPPGVGKSHCCKQGDYYLHDGDANNFWLGYAGESTVCVTYLNL